MNKDLYYSEVVDLRTNDYILQSKFMNSRKECRKFINDITFLKNENYAMYIMQAKAEVIGREIIEYEINDCERVM